MARHFILSLVLCWALPVMATPKVVTSILPIHSLVSGVMDGVGEPQLLIGANASPHAYALKPSDARRLSEAELIVWVGESLEAMLEKPLRSLPDRARVLELSSLEGMRLLPTREAGAWQDRGHVEADSKESHEHAHHGAGDTHLWLSPGNARRIVTAVAGQLSEMDKANAGRYRENAAAMTQRIESLEKGIRQQLAPVQAVPYIVFHDAYHYFEDAFGLHPAGAIAISPDRRPGARRISEIRQAIRKSGARCVFSEPQFQPAIVKVVLEGSGARQGVLDPLGASLKPGKEQWFSLMQNLADELSRCLGSDL